MVIGFFVIGFDGGFDGGFDVGAVLVIGLVYVGLLLGLVCAEDKSITGRARLWHVPWLWKTGTGGNRIDTHLERMNILKHPHKIDCVQRKYTRIS